MHQDSFSQPQWRQSKVCALYLWNYTLSVSANLRALKTIFSALEVKLLYCLSLSAFTVETLVRRKSCEREAFSTVNLSE
jgi:hypothetical protein